MRTAGAFERVRRSIARASERRRFMPENNPNTPVAIYALTNRVGEIRYVGKSINPGRRFLQHRQRGKLWAFSFHVIEWVSIDSPWQDRERFWIAYYRQFTTLDNVAPGGGWHGTPTPETRQRISRALKGRKFSDETKAKLCAFAKQRKASPETCAKISAGNKGKARSGEYSARLSARQLGKKRGPMSVQQRKKIGDWQKGRIKSPEHRAKIGAAHVGMKRSPETRANISNATMGRRPWNKGIKTEGRIHRTGR